jgi:hypothetical protein
MRQRFCRVCSGWHDLEVWPHNCMPETAGAPSDAFPVPFLATDTMQPVQSMLDGKMYDSKSALRATYKAAGVTEVGNDPARLRPRKKTKIDRQAVKTTIDIATARFNRGERASKP